MENMGKSKPEYIPFLRNIGLTITYKCPAKCSHCIVDAGPNRAEELSFRDAFDWIEQISSYREGFVRMLSLTGGEPFYNLDRLNGISSFADARGLFVSSVTNAYWAKTRKKAIKILSQIPSLRMISISTDAYHQEFVPLERALNAVLAAEDCNIIYNINICTTDQADPMYKKTMNDLARVAKEGSILTTFTVPVGRANRGIDRSGYRLSNEPPASICGSLSSPIISPDGLVIACCGAMLSLSSPHPLILGNLKEKPLSTILDDAELNPILHAIRIWGPRKLISIAKEAGLSKYLPERYLENSICSACYEVMSRPEIIDFLDKLSQDFEFRRMIAYARAYYLHEYKMAEHYKLTIRE